MPEDLFAHFADRRPQDRNRFRRIEIEDGQEVLMLKPCFRAESASTEQRVFQTYGGSFAKGCAYVKLIISFQVAAVNDAEDFLLMILPIVLREHRGNAVNLPRQPSRSGNIVTAFQRGFSGSLVVLMDGPLCDCPGVVPRTRIRYVEHIPQFGGVACRVNQGNALGPPADIPAHGLVPKGILRAGRCVRPLSVDHELFMIGIFVQSCGSDQEPCPRLVAAGDLSGRVMGHLHVGLGCALHRVAPFMV